MTILSSCGSVSATGSHLSVEICTKGNEGAESVRDSVLAGLKEAFSSSRGKASTVLVLNQAIRNLPIELLRKVEHVRLYEPGRQQLPSTFSIDGVAFDVIVHDLSTAVSKMYHNPWMEPVDAKVPGEHAATGVFDPLASEVIQLPARALDCIWDSLIFSPPIHENLLTTLVDYVSISRAAFQEMATAARAQRILSNATVFLWGAPGVGKTSLCKALAQRLSVRLKPLYPKSKLVELPASGVYSRYFRESAKLVWGYFNQLASMIREEKDTLVRILIDEVESLCPSREQSLSSQEPRDGQRAFSALLTAVDQLRQYPNFLIFCTSNFVNAMDDAFIDDVDFKLHIPAPTAVACTEILRRSYVDIPMGHLRPVQSLPVESVHAETMLTEDNTPIFFEDFLFRRVPGPHFRQSGERANSFAYLKAAVEEQLVPLDTALLRFGPNSDHPGIVLWRIAQKCEVLSARTIQRLPMLSLVQRSVGDLWPCPLDQALQGLGRLIDQEVAAVNKRKTAPGVRTLIGACSHVEMGSEVEEGRRAAEAA